jgi:hypothetical protein
MAVADAHGRRAGFLGLALGLRAGQAHVGALGGGKEIGGPCLSGSETGSRDFGLPLTS